MFKKTQCSPFSLGLVLSHIKVRLDAWGAAGLTGSELTPHQLGLGSLPAVKQPTLPVRPQNQSRSPAMRRRIGRTRPEESQVHGHPPKVVQALNGNCRTYSCVRTSHADDAGHATGHGAWELRTLRSVLQSSSLLPLWLTYPFDWRRFNRSVTSINKKCH